VVRPKAWHPRPCRNYLFLAAMSKGKSQQSGRHPKTTSSLHIHAPAHVESTTLSLHNTRIVPCLFELFLTFSVDPSASLFSFIPTLNNDAFAKHNPRASLHCFGARFSMHEKQLLDLLLQLQLRTRSRTWNRLDCGFESETRPGSDVWSN
jgi:hypothetical protein